MFGILQSHGFKLKENADPEMVTIPWRSDSVTKSIVRLEPIHSEYPPNWVFSVKITSLFVSNYIMTINANLIHSITKLPNVQNWKVIFKIPSFFDYKLLIPELFKSPLDCAFAQLIGNE